MEFEAPEDVQAILAGKDVTNEIEIKRKKVSCAFFKNKFEILGMCETCLCFTKTIWVYDSWNQKRGRPDRVN